VIGHVDVTLLMVAKTNNGGELPRKIASGKFRRQIRDLTAVFGCDTTTIITQHHRSSSTKTTTTVLGSTFTVISTDETILGLRALPWNQSFFSREQDW
jgi:hypothetical protein